GEVASGKAHRGWVLEGERQIGHQINGRGDRERVVAWVQIQLERGYRRYVCHDTVGHGHCGNRHGGRAAVGQGHKIESDEAAVGIIVVAAQTICCCGEECKGGG